MKKLILTTLLLASTAFANGGSGDIGTGDGETNRCLPVYQEAVLTTKMFLQSNTIGKQLMYNGPGFVKHAWKDGHPVIATLFAIVSPIVSPLATAFEQVGKVLPEKKNLKTYDALIKVLSETADAIDLARLKNNLDLENVTDEDLSKRLMMLSTNGELCTLKEPTVSLSPVGMKTIQERGYKTAMDAYLAGEFGNDRDWWRDFEKDHSNFELNKRGALTTNEIKNLVQ
jgi:hypothetical protein